MVRIDSLLNGNRGCPTCARLSRTLSESDARSRIESICNDVGIQFLGFVVGWTNTNTRLSMSCACGCSWTTRYSSLVHSKSSCPSCAKSGYDPSKPGTFYVYLWVHPNGRSFIKYGITNHPQQRISQQKSKTEFDPIMLFSMQFDDGRIAADIERSISVFKIDNQIDNPVARHEFRDGFSETLPVECWPSVSDIISTYS